MLHSKFNIRIIFIELNEPQNQYIHARQINGQGFVQPNILTKFGLVTEVIRSVDNVDRYQSNALCCIHSFQMRTLSKQHSQVRTPKELYGCIYTSCSSSTLKGTGEVSANLCLGDENQRWSLSSSKALCFWLSQIAQLQGTFFSLLSLYFA